MGSIQGQHRKLYIKPKFLVRDSENGFISARFVTATGLEATIEKIQYREGGALAPVNEPGLIEFSDIELSRGVSDVPDFFQWINDVVDMLAFDGGGGMPSPNFMRDLSFEQLDRDNRVAHTYDSRRCWPLTWKAPDFDNGASEISMESLTLAQYFFTREPA